MRLTVKEFKDRINEFDDNMLIDIIDKDVINDDITKLKHRVVEKIWDIRKLVKRLVLRDDFNISLKNTIDDHVELISGLYRKCLFMLYEKNLDETALYMVIDKVDVTIGELIKLLNEGILDKDRKTKCKINELRDISRITASIILEYRTLLGGVIYENESERI